MNKIFYSSIILSILLLSMVSGASAQNESIGNLSLHTPAIIEVDKMTGKPLGNVSNMSVSYQDNLTPEEIQKIEEIKASINLNVMRFASGYRLYVKPGVDKNLTRDSEYYLIQFYYPLYPSALGSVDEETRNILRELGVVFLDPIDGHTYYTKISSESFDTLESLVDEGKIRYIGIVPAEAKIRPELLAKAQEKTDDFYLIVVKLFEDDETKVNVNELKKFMRIESYSKVTHDVYGDVSGGNIIKICDLDFVRWVEEETPARVFNNDGTSAVADDVVLWFSGLTGSGVRVAVADTGIAQEDSTYHDDLPSSRVIDQHHFKYLWPDDEIAEDENGHGTHVAGIIGGSGSRNSRHRGMALGVPFLIYRMFNRDGSMEPFQFDDCAERAAEHDAVVFSNSWGGGNGIYDSHSEIADKAVRGEYTNSSGYPRYMNVIIAAGNDNDLIAAPGTAKNAITVGAAKDGNFPPSELCWLPCCDYDWPQGETVCFTNFGPLDIDNDGNTRVKPNVIAPGVRITSTTPWYDCWLEDQGIINLGDYYGTLDGTSMATPFVSGAIALYLEKYPLDKDWPEIVKAMVINTAVDVGNPKTRQGHGMVDAFHLIYDESSIFKTLLIAGSYLDNTITSRDFTFNVPSDFEEVKVTLTWADPAGSTEIYNDLDFKVYDGNGDYVGGSYHSDDTVENRKISSGAPGE